MSPDTWLATALDQAADPTATGPGGLPLWEVRLAEAGRACGPERADAARV
ncbi:hypothetical protein GA0115252_13931, partial [Streptomyces sp. DfronAA-171]